MIMLLTMEIFRVASLLLFFCFYSTFCFPSRPLNERSTELAWQAWLLVDDQNQNKHYDSDTIPRRRITPKSVFIAPTFSPESLPACAEGYQPDPMGRCIKFIKYDEEAHLDFLLEKLNAKFGNYDEIDEESQEEHQQQNSGPFQLNIPLDGEKSEEQTKDHLSQGHLNIAIVVAPTNGNFGLEDNMKTDVKRTQLNGNSEVGSKPTPPTESLLETQQVNSNNNNNLKRKTENKYSSDETTTTELNVEESTTVLPEYDTATSVLDLVEESTPYLSTAETESTTSENEDTTVSNQHALFFLKPSLINTGHVRNGTNNAEDTPVVASGNDSVVISNDSLTTLLSNSTFVVDASINLNNKQHLPNAYKQDHQIQFRDPSLSSTDNGDLMPSENVAGFVRFPSEDTTTARIVQNPTVQFLPSLNTYADRFQHGPQQDVNNFQKIRPPSNQFGGGLFGDYVDSRGADLKTNERFVFKSHNPVPEMTFPGNLGSDPENTRHKTHINHDRTHSSNNDRYQTQTSSNNRVLFNHRNRDKHSSLWSIPSSWGESSPQKPIVLRFSRRSGNSRQLLEEHLRPHTQNSPTFYREFPTEDFSYIFGINEDTNHDRKRTHR